MSPGVRHLNLDTETGVWSLDSLMMNVLEIFHSVLLQAVLQLWTSLGDGKRSLYSLIIGRQALLKVERLPLELARLDPSPSTPLPQPLSPGDTGGPRWW